MYIYIIIIYYFYLFIEQYLNKATVENNIRTKAIGSDYCNNRYWYFQIEPNMIFVEQYDENVILSNNKSNNFICLIYINRKRCNFSN